MILHSPDTCECMNKAIELYDTNDRPKNYKNLININNALLDGDDSVKLPVNQTYKYFKCRHCKVVYDIDWIFNSKVGNFPVPLLYTQRKEEFLKKFINKN